MAMNQSKSSKMLSEREYIGTGVITIARSFGFTGKSELMEYVLYAKSIVGSSEFTWKYENYCKVWEIHNSPLGQALR